MKRLLAIGLAVVMVLGVSAGIAGATEEEAVGPKKVWLCHFEDNNHEAPMPYGDDRNGPTVEGFFTTTKTDPPTNIYRDYIVKYNEDRWLGIPAGLNGNQVDLCEWNYGEFILVSVNAIGSDEDMRGHRAQLTELNLPTYPPGWKG